MEQSPRIATVRSFNRFYTRQIGMLNEGIYQSDYSLPEVRVLYELTHQQRPTATQLRKDLGLDAGYLSRLVTGLTLRGLVKRTASPTDRRQSVLRLTGKGKRIYAALERRSNGEVAAMLDRLSDAAQRRVVQAMGEIQRSLGDGPSENPPYILRPHRPGDIGWVVYRHGALYSLEYGWDERFEALVARVAADFVDNFDPQRERCWIAEREGENVGSVFLVQQSKAVAKLRLLLVEPAARGLGIGRRLVDECVRFARQAGYRQITLWTNSRLSAARAIYDRAGFRMVDQKPDPLFGSGSVGETWDLIL